MFENEKFHWWYAGRRVLLESILHNLHLQPLPHILDIGCGTGFTMSLLSRFGDVSGVDKSASAIDFCRKRGFSQIKKTDGNILPFRNNSFDLITCLDVMEHVKNDKNMLTEVKRVLKPKGYFIIFVPAFSFLWSKLDIRSKHYRRYELYSFKKLLETSGFSVSCINYFNYVFFLPILLIRLWQKTSFGKNGSWGLDPVIRNFTLNRILSLLFNFDVWSAPKVHPAFGVSISAVCVNN